MNKFYHEFSIGFNWWYVVLPVLMLAMALLGTVRYQKRPGFNMIVGWRFEKFYPRLAKAVAVILDFVFLYIVTSESAEGIAQWFLNHLDAETAPDWAFILLIGALYVIAMIGYILLIASARVGENLKYAYLRHVIRREKVRYTRQRLENGRKPKKTLDIAELDKLIEQLA